MLAFLIISLTIYCQQGLKLPHDAYPFLPTAFATSNTQYAFTIVLDLDRGHASVLETQSTPFGKGIGCNLARSPFWRNYSHEPQRIRVSFEWNNQWQKGEIVIGGERLPFAFQMDSRVKAWFAAVGNGDTKAVEQFVSEGFPIETQDTFGRTALMQTVQLGREALMVTLLKQGADPLFKNCLGESVLDALKTNSHIKERFMAMLTEAQKSKVLVHFNSVK